MRGFPTGWSFHITEKHVLWYTQTFLLYTLDVERASTGQFVKYILFNYVSLIMLIFIFICLFLLSVVINLLYK